MTANIKIPRVVLVDKTADEIEAAAAANPGAVILPFLTSTYVPCIAGGDYSGLEHSPHAWRIMMPMWVGCATDPDAVIADVIDVFCQFERV